MKHSARTVFYQNDGEVTKTYYTELGALGPRGEIGVALFRAQKRSSAAKTYRRGSWRGSAYDVKAWSMGEICRLLREHGDNEGITWGWKQDPNVVFGERPSWVLYCELPTGQVSFHSPTRLGDGPEFTGEWDKVRGASEQRVIAFCESVERESQEPCPYDSEPDCNCIRLDVDLDDACMCELHNLNSQWNKDCRAWDAARDRSRHPVAPVQTELCPITDDDTPF